MLAGQCPDKLVLAAEQVPGVADREPKDAGREGGADSGGVRERSGKNSHADAAHAVHAHRLPASGDRQARRIVAEQRAASKHPLSTDLNSG
jgi:hypothetical protein